LFDVTFVPIRPSALALAFEINDSNHDFSATADQAPPNWPPGQEALPTRFLASIASLRVGADLIASFRLAERFLSVLRRYIEDP
jgi:hypothetical protein